MWRRSENILPAYPHLAPTGGAKNLPNTWCNSIACKTLTDAHPLRTLIYEVVWSPDRGPKRYAEDRAVDRWHA